VVSKAIDPLVGPSIQIELTGVNQRGEESINATGTILVASRQHGPVKLPDAPADVVALAPKPIARG
jgi:hypothetical protein